MTALHYYFMVGQSPDCLSFPFPTLRGAGLDSDMSGKGCWGRQLRIIPPGSGPVAAGVQGGLAFSHQLCDHR
jgi:hypothetical protein